ncbi:gamma carbonic anhydrase family protein [Candidatus Ichthyocystis hellenicum]|uniref:gamma carbonic anhydrase family protein n=1 Tax=Candidatus Ichthyocystis hellenicum TaxID=1561003 RepID=UPI000B82E43F|nr:gamma carbonic anhydrase family protein [Candidatus Ichthyocystis hellenicum]
MRMFPESICVSQSAWVAPNACLIGNVCLSDNVSIWFGSILRADNEPIMVADSSNIQDGCIVHNDEGYPVNIGKLVTIGHGTILHGCIIGDQSLVGMGCVILNGCRVSSLCLIGAGSLLIENTFVPEGSLVIGRPGKVVRSLTQKEIEQIEENALKYVQKKESYRQQD